MAYKIDRIFQTDGTELSNATHTTTLAGATSMAYDGRYLWVTCGTAGIAIYEFWGAASDNEPLWENLDELTYQRYDSSFTKKLRLVTYITVAAATVKRTTCLPSMSETGSTTYTQASGIVVYAKSTARTGVALNAYHIKKCADKMYVSNGATFSEIYEFSIETQKLLSVIDVHEVFPGPTFTTASTTFTAGASYGMNSNMQSANCKLWFVGSSFGDTSPQTLYSFNVLTRVKTATPINVRPSLARTYIANGHNGFVYITNVNNVSIQKYSDIDGTLSKTIRVNGFPNFIYCGPDRKIWVSSFGGMLSLVDWDDDEVHNSYSTGVGDSMRAISLQTDPTAGNLIWMVDVNNKLIRYNVNDSSQLDTITTTDDWSMTSGTYTGNAAVQITAPTSLLMTHQMYFQDAAVGTHNLQPYMFLIQAGKLLAWKLDRYLYRENFSTINGQAAVVESAQLYFGE